MWVCACVGVGVCMCLCVIAYVNMVEDLSRYSVLKYVCISDLSNNTNYMHACAHTHTHTHTGD